MERKPWASVPKIWYNFCTSQQLCAQRKFNIFCLQLLKTNGWERATKKVTIQNDLRISYIWSCKACVKFEWFLWIKLQNWRPFPGSLWPSLFPTDPLKVASKQQPIHMKMWQKALKYFGFPLADTAHFEIN